MTILLTGCAGFIGHRVAQELLSQGEKVLGADALPLDRQSALRSARLGLLSSFSNFAFERVDLSDALACAAIFEKAQASVVIHLAAQPGVGESMTNPTGCARSNIMAFVNALEGARAAGAIHMLYASSSSVYGLNASSPSRESDSTAHPLSLYAASKLANEAMAHSYAHSHGLPLTGLRFFTVYGPYGRPDMAPMIFARSILEGRPIVLRGDGSARRSFTSVADVARGVALAALSPARPDPLFNPLSPSPASSSAPHRVYNLGNESSIELSRFVSVLESALGKKALIERTERPAWDAPFTACDNGAFHRAFGFSPAVPIELGLEELALWARRFPNLLGA